MKIRELPLTTNGYMVGDYTSTSPLTGVKADPALSVFAVGLPVSGRTCTLGDVTSCDEPMEASAGGFQRARLPCAAPSGTRF
jgi:hypothetical protein